MPAAASAGDEFLVPGFVISHTTHPGPGCQTSPDLPAQACRPSRTSSKRGRPEVVPAIARVRNTFANSTDAPLYSLAITGVWGTISTRSCVVSLELPAPAAPGPPIPAPSPVLSPPAVPQSVPTPAVRPGLRSGLQSVPEQARARTRAPTSAQAPARSGPRARARPRSSSAQRAQTRNAPASSPGGV